MGKFFFLGVVYFCFVIVWFDNIMKCRKNKSAKGSYELII